MSQTAKCGRTTSLRRPLLGDRQLIYCGEPSLPARRFDPTGRQLTLSVSKHRSTESDSKSLCSASISLSRSSVRSRSRPTDDLATGRIEVSGRPSAGGCTRLQLAADGRTVPGQSAKPSSSGHSVLPSRPRLGQRRQGVVSDVQDRENPRFRRAFRGRCPAEKVTQAKSGASNFPARGETCSGDPQVR
jgi:hypothetical protein